MKVTRYVTPEEFNKWKKIAEKMGFRWEGKVQVMTYGIRRSNDGMSVCGTFFRF